MAMAIAAQDFPLFQEICKPDGAQLDKSVPQPDDRFPTNQAEQDQSQTQAFLEVQSSLSASGLSALRTRQRLLAKIAASLRTNSSALAVAAAKHKKRVVRRSSSSLALSLVVLVWLHLVLRLAVPSLILSPSAFSKWTALRLVRARHCKLPLVRRQLCRLAAWTVSLRTRPRRWRPRRNFSRYRSLFRCTCFPCTHVSSLVAQNALAEAGVDPSLLTENSDGDSDANQGSHPLVVVSCPASLTVSSFPCR